MQYLLFFRMQTIKIFNNCLLSQYLSFSIPPFLPFSFSLSVSFNWSISFKYILSESECKIKISTYVYLWLIHVDVWQKSTQYCKAIILQLKIEKINLWGENIQV